MNKPLWDLGLSIDIIPRLLDGLWLTIIITLIAMAIALVLGLAVAVIRQTRIPVLSQVFDFYVHFIRGTPLLVQLFLVYFGLPAYGIVYPAIPTAIVVLGINYSAYTAEVYRSGVEDVPKGQWEAGTALSLPMPLTWTRVVLPQALRAVIPMLGNYLVQMFKDSALVFTITVLELMGTAKAIGNERSTWIEPLTLAAILYLIVSLISSLLIRTLESRLALNR